MMLVKVKYGSIDIIRKRPLQDDDYYKSFEVVELMKDYAIVMCNNCTYAFKNKDLNIGEPMLNV